MRRKILAIVLAAALVASGLGGIALAQEEDNEVMVIFATNWNYEVVEDNFDNDEVTGWIEWHTHLWNNSDASGEPIIELTQRLDSDQEFCSVTQDPLPNMGPPIYEWECGNITEGADLMVGMSGCPELSPITFNPGFDATRMLDETEFLQSEGTQTQTLTITLTPQDVIDRWFYIHVSSPQDDELVDAVIRSVDGDSDFEFDLYADGHELDIVAASLEPGRTYTCNVILDVTPEVPYVKSIPYVEIKFVEDPPDTYEIDGSSITNSIQDQEGEIGTWTLSAEGIYLWRWWEELFGGIFWSSSSAQSFEHPMTGQKLVGSGAFAEWSYPYETDVNHLQTGFFLINPDCVSEITVDHIFVFAYDGTVLYEGSLRVKVDDEWEVHTGPLKPHQTLQTSLSYYDLPEIKYEVEMWYTVEIPWTWTDKEGLPLTGWAASFIVVRDAGGQEKDIIMWGTTPMVNMKQELKPKD